MAPHFFDTATLPVSPWKNGGGSTREIVCVPAGAGLDAFEWRASLASIDRAGPFSTFPGVDRTIVWLAGADVRLRSRDGVIDHRLGPPHTPLRFAGEVSIEGEPLGSASTDFNLMTRRGRWHADVGVSTASESIPPAEAGLLLAWQGRWRLDAEEATTLDAGTGVWWEGGPRRWHATPAQGKSVLIGVRLTRAAVEGPP